tara:strand:- start:19813 stop:20712 length:900 start_codon:yes stop_codon:yes gene_type:complete
MEARLNADLTREQILDMTNKCQNEILAHDNRITRILPDPFMHTGSDSFTGSASNALGDITFDVTTAIPTTVATKGYIQVTDAGITDKYEYQNFTGMSFVLADDVTLTRAYTTSATMEVDQFDIIASGSLFSSVRNERNTVQWDVRRVSRIYAYSNNIGGRGFGSNSTPGSRNPEYTNNYNGNQIEVPADTIESKEPLSGDCRVVFWQDNSPPKNPSQQVYFVRAQRWPNQLISETVPLEIPDRFQTTLLRFAILRDEEYREWGRDDNPNEKYNQFMKEFLTWADVGSESVTKTYTTPRF